MVSADLYGWRFCGLDFVGDEMSIENDLDSDALNAAYIMGFQDGKKKREWVGLTDEEIEGLYEFSDLSEFDIQLARHIEAKLRSKNGY